MVDISNNKWTQLDDGNITSSPDGVQGGYQPSTIAPIIRNIRGAVKREYVSSNPVYTSTGTANVYAISFEQPLEITKGKRISFIANVTNTGASTINLNTAGAVAIVRRDGTALQAGDIIANIPVDIVYDGNRYVLQSSPNLSNYSGTIKATAFDGNGAALTDLNATNLTTGTINNARLPDTMTGKTFSSATEILVGGLSVAAGGATIVGNTSITGTATITGDATISGSLTQGGKRVLTLLDVGAGKGLDADLLDGQHGTYYLARGNHTGTQAMNTIAGLQAVIDMVNDAWALQPLGALIAVTPWGGFPTPPTNKAYRYVLLSGGQAGSGQYNNGVLINESTSGSAPNIQSTAVVNLPGSPFHNLSIRLINTERRFLRPGVSGGLQDSQNKLHSHHVNDPGHSHALNVNPLKGPYNGANQDSGPGSAGSNWGVGMSTNATGIWLSNEGGDEARPRNMGVDYYMRIL